MCSQEDSPASHSVLQGRERERKITATSGVKCYEQYGKFSPLGLLAKTLMESSQWYSLARRLRWGVRTIYSKRITYTEKSSNSQLTPSVKTLKVQDIPSSRLLFQLVPSEHPTEEIGCGLLRDLMPTPIAGDAQGGATKLTKGKRLRNGKVYSATLKDLVASNMLPTVQTQGLKICNKEGKTEFLNLFFTANTNSNRQRDRKDKQIFEQRCNRTSNIGKGCKDATSSNTQCFGGHKVDNKIQCEQSNGERTDGKGMFRTSFNTNGKGWNALRYDDGYSEATQQAESQFGRADCPQSWWRDFPTQSPVCNRDDGLPFRVADLTISFAKWRNKSIEALGNAWVPQVAFEIFKAINEIQKKSV